MVAMRNCFVTAIGSVLMSLFMRSAVMLRCALRRVIRADGDLVLAHVITVHVVQVSIVKVIHVTVVFHGWVAAVRTMHMRVRFMNFVISTHRGLLDRQVLHINIRLNVLRLCEMPQIPASCSSVKLASCFCVPGAPTLIDNAQLT